jgi:hypothetical protein
MESLSFLGTYLVMALLLPGFVVLTVAAVLFPELRTVLGAMTTPQLVGIVCLASFLSGHIPYFVERYLLTRLWNLLYPAYGLAQRSIILSERGVIVIRCDIAGLSRRHLDAALGSFIFYYNTSFWCVTLSVVASTQDSGTATFRLALGIGLISLVALFFTAPLYKKSLLDILEAMKAELALRRAATGIFNNNAHVAVRPRAW